MAEMTSWAPAVGLLGVLLGTPFLLTAPVAGALSDRFDRRLVAASAAALMAATCGAVGLLLWGDWLNPASLGVAALVVSTPVAAVVPPLQAMVPSLVPADRLMNGVALQNLAMLAAVAAGVLMAGLVIELFGTPTLFLIVGGLGLVSAALLMALPADVGLDHGDETSSLRLNSGSARGWTAVREGFSYARRDPVITSLIAVGAIIGIASAAAQLLIPLFAESVLDSGAIGAGLMNAAMAFGLITTASILAARSAVSSPIKLVGLVFATIAGPGLIAIGSARSLAVALMASLIWGMGGGVVMTLQRTLIQSRTEAAVMGRIMGLSTMAQFGTFPLGSILVFAVVGSLGVAGTMVAFGVVVLVLAVALSLRLLSLAATL